MVFNLPIKAECYSTSLLRVVVVRRRTELVPLPDEDVFGEQIFPVREVETFSENLATRECSGGLLRP
jgi:hypothetical protein